MITGLAVYDEFLPRPDRLIAEAAGLKYARSTLNPSNRVSEKSPLAKRLAPRLAKLAGVGSVRWFPGSPTYRKTTKAEVARTKNAFFCHSDGAANFVALLYLSAAEECHGGTGLYRHRATGLHGFHDLLAVEKTLSEHAISFPELVRRIEKDARRPSAWELTDLVAMQHNRLIIYNGGRFHSHVFDFARVASGAERLTLMCFGETTQTW